MAVRRGGSNLGLLLLAGQILNFGIERIPPATLALIAGQAAIFMDLFPQYFPQAHSVCISSYLVYHHRDWMRMILSAFYHANDLHLYFNMISLLYKGSFLEKKFGTRYFIYLVGVFTVLTSAVYVGIGLLLAEVLHDHGYVTSCAVGFSGVLFALKVLATHYSPAGPHYLLGIVPIPSKYIYWAELVLIQLMVPNASFVGHLAGILVGVAYIWGPLKLIMNAFLQPGGSSYSRQRQESPRRHRAFWYQRPYGTWATPSAPAYDVYQGSQGIGAQPRSYDSYTGGYDENEQYNRAVQQSMADSSQAPGSNNLYPDLDDLRARRAQFYQ